MTGKKVRQSLIGLAAAATMSIAPGARAAENLRITIPVPAFSYYSIYAARDLGYFKDEGIDMEIIVTQGDGPDVDALIAGSAQFTASTPNRLFTTFQQGKPLLGILNMFNRVAINCFVNNESAAAAGIDATTPIDEKFKKLKGMTIGVSRPGSFTYYVAANFLKRAGYTPQEDAKIIGVGGGPSMLAAIENKQIDVGCFASPTPELAVSRGKSSMFVNNTLGEDKTLNEFLFAVLYVRPDYVKEHEETVTKVVRALKRAMTYIKKTPFDEQKKLLTATFGEMDQTVLRDALANNQAAINESGEISENAYKGAADYLIASGAIKEAAPYASVIDKSYWSK
jgi:NitT/TauT family transport system substrate-binding protein